MSTKYTQITKKELNLTAKNKDIKEPQKMSTKDLTDAISRYDSKRNSYSAHRKFNKLRLNKLNDLQKIAILRIIKNFDKLSREDLMYMLLRSESDLVESSYEKYISSNTNDEIKSKINNIKIIIARLGNTITKDVRKNDLHEIEKKQGPTKTQKQRTYNHLVELSNALNKKEEYQYSDYDNLDYFRIRDIENLFINIDDSNYYKPVLVRRSFKKNYEYYEVRGDRDKKLSIKQYLTMIIPHLTKLINQRKNNNSEYKIQLSMGVSFMCITDKEKTRIFDVRNDNEEIRLGNNTSNVVSELIKSFLSNYQKEGQILRNGSNYIYESVDVLDIYFHSIKLKRGSSYIDFPR